MPSGARSSSTTWARRASASPPGRCPPSAAKATSARGRLSTLENPLARLVTTLLAFAALAAPAAAVAAPIDINNDGYSPKTITIAPGGSLQWHYNNDAFHPHGVQFGSDT